MGIVGTALGLICGYTFRFQEPYQRCVDQSYRDRGSFAQFYQFAEILAHYE